MFNIQVRNLENVKAFLQRVPQIGIPQALHDIAFFLRGDNREGLAAPPPERYVSRADAEYTTSLAQIRFFFAKGIWVSDGQGGVILNRYNRTNDLPNSWQMVETGAAGGPYGFRLVNNAPGAKYVYGDSSGQGQANQPRMVGWVTAIQQIRDRLPAAIRYAQERLNTWLKLQKP
jgi:hypothetical protein